MTSDSAANRKPRASRIVSIDYGLARIGIALSDESKILATSLIDDRKEVIFAGTSLQDPKIDHLAHQVHIQPDVLFRENRFEYFFGGPAVEMR